MQAQGVDTYCNNCGRMFQAHEWSGPCPNCGWDGDDKPEDIEMGNELEKDIED